MGKAPDIWFEVNDEFGRFVCSASIADLTTPLQRIQDRWWEGESFHKTKDSLKTFTGLYPGIPDGWVELAEFYEAFEEIEEAQEHYRKVFQICDPLIPKDFKGEIPGIGGSNLAYLRSLHGMASCCRQLEEHKEASIYLKQLMRYMPSDNFGARFWIGSEHLRAGKKSQAIKHFRKHAEEYPPYLYEMGLVSIMDEEWASAATWLRKAFLSNIYIAGALCGDQVSRPVVMSHGTSYHAPVMVDEYLTSNVTLWIEVPQALQFLHWLFNHPTALRERADFIGVQQALYWEGDFEKRGRLICRSEEIIRFISDASSYPLVEMREAPQSGEMMRPWVHPRSFPVDNLIDRPPPQL